MPTGSNIGVIGPRDLVAEMVEMGRRYPQYRFLDLSYDDEREALDIFRKNRSIMSVCLFSGDWPYAMVVQEFGDDLDVRLVYAHDAGPALPKTLMAMIRDGRDISCLSIDTVPEEELQECFHEMGHAPEEHHLMVPTPPAERDAYLEFHKGLWEQGKTTGAITFLKTAYDELVAQGVPAYRGTPTRGALRESVARAALEASGIRMRRAQTVVGLVDVDPSPQRVGTRLYHDQRRKASLHRGLLELVEVYEIPVVPLEGVSFALFLTRGTLMDMTDGYRSFPRMEDFGDKVYFGFGIGGSMNMSMSNARTALESAHEVEESCVFVVSDEEIIGPLAHAGGTRIRRSNLDQNVLDRLSKSGLGLATISRVEALTRRTGSTSITPGQLAAGLSISKRNARRVLSRMADAGLAEVIGLEQTHRRGRPQRIFRICLDHHAAEKGVRNSRVQTGHPMDEQER